jgi:hypothetical protein
MSITVGSILHGAYGDYYEQVVALRYFKWKKPHIRLVLFFASDLRKRELEVFDLSFADEVHSVAAISEIPIDWFFQFQVQDSELQQKVLNHLPPAVLAKIDQTQNVKPWAYVRKVWWQKPELGDVPLGELGLCRLPICEVENNIPPDIFHARFTIGFLWRYRRAGGPISACRQRSQDKLIRMRSELFRALIAKYNAHVLVCGMNVVTTDENRQRTDNKYTARKLDVPPENISYLRGLNWGLELEILRRCSLCILMASGFSEALWLKRRGKGMLLIDPPPHYVAKLLWNRMPFFHIMRPADLLFQLRQPHTVDKLLPFLHKRNLLPR